MKKKKQLLKRIIAGVMLVFMVCGLVSSTPNAYAAEGDVYMGVSIPYSLLFPGATYSTHYYTMELADGEIYTAYCIEANKGILNQGSYSLDEVTYQTHPLLIKVLACGYYGPNDITEKYFDTDEKRYLATHIAASYAYNTIALGHEDFTGIPGATIDEQRANFEASGIADFVRECNDYVLKDGTVTVAMDNDGSTQNVGCITYWEKVEEDFVTIEIPVLKVDAERGYSHSGFAGAEYSLFSSDANFENGALLETVPVTEDGEGGMPIDGSSFEKGQYKAVFELQIKEEGYFYIQETKAPYGFYLNDTKYKFIVERQSGKLVVISVLEGDIGENPELPGGDDIIQYPGENTELKDGFVVDGDIISMETPAKSKFSFTKKNPAGEGLEGAGFQVWREEEILIIPEASFGFGSGAYYDFNAAEPIVVTADGGKVLYTDANGYAETCELGFGTYVIKETVVPEGYYPIQEPDPLHNSLNGEAPLVDYFRIRFDDASKDLYYYGDVIDKPVEARLRIIKKDDVTGKNILSPDTTFKIYDVKNSEYIIQSEISEFKTDANGVLLLPEIIKGGEYRIEEVVTPSDRYVLGQSVTIVIDKDLDKSETDENGIPIFTVEYENTAIVGTVEVTKLGKTLSKFENNSFIWEEAGLVGAKFDVYTAEDIYYDDLRNTEDGSGKEIRYAAGTNVGSIVTGSNGKGTLSNLPLGKYTLVEKEVPEGYILDSTPVEFEISRKDELTSVVVTPVSVFNEKNNVSVSVVKKDSVDGTLLEGATFGLYANEDIKNYVGTVICPKDTLICEAVSGTDGVATFDVELPFVSYVVKEISAPFGYIKTDEEWVVDAKNDDVVNTIASYSSEFTNKPLKAYLRVIKKDAETDKSILSAETTFKIFDVTRNAFVSQNGTEEFKTNKDGVMLLAEPLNAGTYRIDEVATPSDHYIKGESITITIDETTVDASDWDVIPTYEVDFDNTAIVGSVEVTKTGRTLSRFEDNSFVWEETGLVGAKFDVIAAEDIYYDDLRNTEDGSGKEIRYAAGTNIGTITTGNDGKGTLSNLPVGKYNLVETFAPEGYILDTTPVAFEISKKDEVTSVVITPVSVFNDKNNVSVSVVKKDSVDGTVLEGATFGLYANEDIKNYVGTVICPKDTLICEAVSGTDGVATFDVELPFAKYVVKEISAPTGYIKTDKTWEVEAKYDDVVNALASYSSEFTNKPLKAYLRVIKKDAETDKSILSAETTFKIFDVSAKDYVSQNGTDEFKTNAEGVLLLSEPLKAGIYRIDEVATPSDHYIKGTSITITIDEDTVNATDWDVIPTYEVEFENTPIVGSVEVTKTGRTLSRFEDNSFVWEETGLVGAKFDVYTAEDIYYDDLRNTEDGSGKEIRYAAGTNMGTITTGNDGKGTLTNLPIGKYNLVETFAPEGYILDTTPVAFEISKKDEVTSVVITPVSVFNDKSNVSVSVVKKDSVNGKALEGATFGLYANEDIKNYVGTVICPKDTLICEAVSGTDGVATFDVELPFAKYVVKEISAPTGYIKTDKTWEVEAKYDDVVNALASYSSEFTNKPLKAYLRVIKKDAETDKSILSAETTFKIFDVTRNAFVSQNGTEEFKTNKDGVMLLAEPLNAGTYRIDEVATPSNHYIKGTSITITIDEDTVNATDWDVIPTYEVEFENTPIVGSVEVTKTGESLIAFEDEKFIWEETGLVGATFDVFTAEDIYYDDLRKDEESGETAIRYAAGTNMGTIITDENGKGTLTNLPIGKYTLVETSAPEGYIIDPTPIEFEISKKDELTSVVIEPVSVYNEREALSLKYYKQNSKTKNPLKGATFGLYADEDIKNYKGEVIVTATALICTGTSDETGYIDFNNELPFANYHIEELKAPKGFKKTKEIFEIKASREDINDEGVAEYGEIIYNKPDNPPNTSPSYGFLKLSYDEGLWQKTNYRTDDSGEAGYSVKLTVDNVITERSLDNVESNKGGNLWMYVGCATFLLAGGAITGIAVYGKRKQYSTVSKNAKR